MRTLRSRLSPPARLPAGLALGLALSAAGGCKWTDFDDLKEDTWATAVDKPEKNAAANWGVAITRVNRGGSGGTLAVLGANQAIYDEIAVDPDGGFRTANELDLNTNFSIGLLAVEPLFLSNPDADEAALVTALDGQRISVVRAVNGQLTQLPVGMLTQPGAATYMVTPPRPGMDPGPLTQILVAQADSVYGAYFDQSKAPNPQTKCMLRDDAAAVINIRALGAYRPTGANSDDVLVLTETGKLMAYPGGVFNGCGTGAQAPKAGFVRDVMFPGISTGAQIFVFTDAGVSYALVQMHNDNNKGRLGLYRISPSSIDEIGTPRDLDRLRTAALFQPAGENRRFVLAGLPTNVIDGVTAGQVQVIPFDTVLGLAATPEITLSDAQPEDNQSFGRAVAALPYNGKSIIAVAADNEIFLYFRTTLYGETREGREGR
jgi:hypothetical protein